MKYRKKPVEIIAHRIGDDGWPDEIWDGVNRNAIILHLASSGATVGRPKISGYVEIHTLEGVMRGEVGDYIIRGVKGEFYPCKPDIFEATYERVEGHIIPRITPADVDWPRWQPVNESACAYEATHWMPLPPPPAKEE